MATYKVGDKVTVATTIHDPVHLDTAPFVFVTEVRDDPQGPVYFVGHPAVGSFQATHFGPYPAAKLKAGW